jgi:uncharacterized protein (DUF433 family)
MNQELVRSDSEILGGTPCFPGTCIPVVSLFDYLLGGYDVDEFLVQFLSVHRAQVLALLERNRQWSASDALNRNN